MIRDNTNEAVTSIAVAAKEENVNVDMDGNAVAKPVEDDEVPLAAAKADRVGLSPQTSLGK